MTPIDWIIVALYALFTLAMAAHFGRQQKTTNEAFIGSGQINPLLIGVSLFATLLSTITYFSLPGETLGKGPYFLAGYLIYPLNFLVVGFVLLPLYMRRRVTSAYELLEERLGLSTRLLGAILFVLARLVWMGLMIFLTSKVLVIVMGVEERWIPLVTVTVGFFTVVYTSIGGLRAVVVTDAMQTILLLGGAVLTIVLITWRMGGTDWFPTEWNHEIWDSQKAFSLDFSERVTIFGTLLSGFLTFVATSAGDQMIVQRYMATRDLRAARLALGIQLGVGTIVGITLGLVGFSLLGYFTAHPDMLPDGKTLKETADGIFPWFIGNQLPPVISGLVIAGALAAAMSSLDSGVNSITAVVSTDFLRRFDRIPKDDKAQVRFARLLALGIGGAVVVLSSFMGNVPGNFIEMTARTTNVPTVPLAMLFVFALFLPKTSPAGAWIGTLVSLLAAVLVAYSGVFFKPDPRTGGALISFQWIAPMSLAAGFIGGWIGTLLFPRKANS
jgi:SSS family solute:Na+ symporter